MHRGSGVPGAMAVDLVMRGALRSRLLDEHQNAQVPASHFAPAVVVQAHNHVSTRRDFLNHRRSMLHT